MSKLDEYREAKRRRGGEMMLDLLKAFGRGVRWALAGIGLGDVLITIARHWAAKP